MLAAEAKGRNAVYSLKKGWKVKAFDFSISAKEKAEKLFQSQDKKIDLEVSDVLEFSSDKKFDVIGLS